MPSLFSRIRGKDGKLKSKKNGNLDSDNVQLSDKPRWDDAYARTSIEPQEVQGLVRQCTAELKARALDLPFLLLPFRPTSDPSAVRTFVRHFFDGNHNMQGEALAQELRMTEPMVIAGVLKWCWSRIPGGLVGWDAYELFKVGEQDSQMARDAFATFIPLSIENQAQSQIVFDYFDLLSAIAAHGKTNGFGGRKLSRMASWWAFEHKDTGKGFEGGYKSWISAADATSHLFFAYLRTLSPQLSKGAGISMLPMSLQKLLQETEYPPQTPSLMLASTYKVVMFVDAVSPTPFALLRRANHFQYRDEDQALQAYSEYEDPVKALTEECRRVLKAISLANQSQVSNSKHSTSLRDASWSRFEDIGFGGTLEEEDEDEEITNTYSRSQKSPGLRTTPASGGQFGARPTTPSWADFLSSGFVDETGNSNMLLPPDKILPPIDTTVRQRSSQSHRPRLESDRQLEPGELASITSFDLDEVFFWVWMSSLAPEETAQRKSAFGRCAVIETVIRSGKWLVMEEMVKGAAPEPDANAYIAEKKGLFSWTRRGKGMSRSKSSRQNSLGRDQGAYRAGASKTSVGPDQQAKIQAAAQQLNAKQQQQRLAESLPERRGRMDEAVLTDKTISVLTLQPVIFKEASPAMKWASKYDKEAVREAYLGDASAGRGLRQLNGSSATSTYEETNGSVANGDDLKPEVPGKAASPTPFDQPQMPISPMTQEPEKEEAPTVPQKTSEEVHPAERSGMTGHNSPLPPLPPDEETEVIPKKAHTLEPSSSSPESKKQHRKLHKEEKRVGGGFRKLFGRKNRQSKLPDNAAANVNNFLASNSASAAESSAQPETPRAETGLTESVNETPTVHTEDDKTPTQMSTAPHEPTYDPSADESLSRINTAEANEARDEFSRFDQGPLTDQPAFAGGDDADSVDDATPPPIVRHRVDSPTSQEAEQDDATEHESAPSPSIPTHDRWAAIRRNAAERHAQRQSEEQSRGAQSKTTDGDDDTSGEETIESRVARIKARVAELTGNMEATASPGTPPAAMRR
ncbi:DUF1708-domain-containing protein [Xylariaceae sp. FL0255]|nr:DUF1708-domain-containing protein [Xylariaceae sp. FL0255]